MKKQKHYNITWAEEHSKIVTGFDENNAKERAMNGYGSDDSVKITDFQATEIEKK